MGFVNVFKKSAGRGSGTEGILSYFICFQCGIVSSPTWTQCDLKSCLISGSHDMILVLMSKNITKVD